MAITTVSSHVVSVNAIQGTLIADNAITAVHIATNAVSGTLIADNAITAVHVAQNSITVTQLADDCVESDKIADGVITTNHLNKAMISSQTEVTPVAGDFVLLGDTSDSNNLKKAPLTLLLNSNVDLSTKLNLSGGTLTGALTTNGVINTSTSQNFAINTPNSLRINIDSNDSATDQVFVIGNNQTGVDATNNVLFKVGEDGKVGIGTGAPDYQLHIAGGGDFLVEDTGNGSAHIRLRSSSGGTASSNWKLKTSNNNHFYIDNDTGSAGTAIAIDDTGRVAIGIGDPHAYGQLQVDLASTDAYTPTAFLDKPTMTLRHSDGNGYYNGIRFSNQSGNYEWFLGTTNVASNAADFVWQGYNRTTSAYQEMMRLSDEGNLGLGQPTPTNKLEVHGVKSYVAGIPTGVVAIADNTSMAAGVGGAINFIGKYHSNATMTSAASIEASKANATSGDYGFDMILKTRENGTDMKETIRLTQSQSFIFNNANQGARYFIINQTSDGALIFRYDNANKWQNSQDSAGGLNWYSYTAGSHVVKFHGDGRDYDFISDTANDYTPRINLYSKSSGAYCGEINFYSKHNSNEWVAASIFATGGSGYGTGNPPSGGMRLYVRGAFGDTHAVNAIQIAADGVASGDFNDTSDVALKKDIVSLSASDSITAIKALNPVSFKWKLDNEARSGFIAQEVETHLPNDVVGEDWRAEAVGEEGDPSSRDEGSKGKAVNSTGILAHAVKVIQEQQKEIEALKTRVTTLEG